MSPLDGGFCICVCVFIFISRQLPWLTLRAFNRDISAMISCLFSLSKIAFKTLDILIWNLLSRNKTCQLIRIYRLVGIHCLSSWEIAPALVNVVNSRWFHNPMESSIVTLPDVGYSKIKGINKLRRVIHVEWGISVTIKGSPKSRSLNSEEGWRCLEWFL